MPAHRAAFQRHAGYERNLRMTHGTLRDRMLRGEEPTLLSSRSRCLVGLGNCPWMRLSWPYAGRAARWSTEARCCTRMPSAAQLLTAAVRTQSGKVLESLRRGRRILAATSRLVVSAGRAGHGASVIEQTLNDPIVGTSLQELERCAGSGPRRGGQPCRRDIVAHQERRWPTSLSHATVTRQRRPHLDAAKPWAPASALSVGRPATAPARSHRDDGIDPVKRSALGNLETPVRDARQQGTESV